MSTLVRIFLSCTFHNRFVVVTFWAWRNRSRLIKFCNNKTIVTVWIVLPSKLVKSWCYDKILVHKIKYSVCACMCVCVRPTACCWQLWDQLISCAHVMLSFINSCLRSGENGLTVWVNGSLTSCCVQSDWSDDLIQFVWLKGAFFIVRHWLPGVNHCYDPAGGAFVQNRIEVGANIMSMCSLKMPFYCDAHTCVMA